MLTVLKFALRLQDMFILVAIGLVFLGVAYLVDRIRDELREGSLHATNYSPWEMPELYTFLGALIAGTVNLKLTYENVTERMISGPDVTELATSVSFYVAIVFSLLSLGYFLARRINLRKGLTLLHLAVSLGACLVFCLGLWDFQAGITSQWVGPEPGEMMYANPGMAVRLMGPAAMIFSIGQAIVPLNIFISLKIDNQQSG